MAAYENRGRYKPGMDFGEHNKAPLLDINLTDSTELWLIQWPLNQLKPGDFEGKELSLKLHKNKDLGTFESSSGKSYEVVSVGAKEPDATVFLPSESGASAVGKISRRVCLVRYPDPKELARPRGLNTSVVKQEPKDTDYSGKKPKYSTPTKSEASKMTHGASHETQASAHKSGKGSTISSHKKKRNGSSEGGSSHVTGMATTESANQTSNSNLEHSISEKKKKKKVSV